MSEETIKRWLAVLIAAVTLCIGIGTFLQNQASSFASLYTRNSQEAAIQATGAQLRGQQRVAFDRYGVLTLTDELYGFAVQNNALNQDQTGQAYLKARDQLTPLSPLLTSDYTKFDNKGFRTETDFGKYEADTYIVSARLADENRSNYAQISSSWNAKSDSYVAVIAIFAISLFLFALAATLSGIMRGLFIVVGLGIGTVALIWMGLTALIPIHGIPQEALQKVAEGTGYAAQATEYYFVGQGIAGMPLPYDVSRVTEPTGIYKTNADQYAAHTNEFWQKAIDTYSEAIKIDPTYASAYNLRGIARRKILPERAQGAVADLKAAIDNGSKQYATYWNLGLAQYDNGDFAGAIESTRNALKLNDRICGPDFTIGLATLAQGNVDQANQIYDQALIRCDSIYQDAIKQKQRPPESLWNAMETASDDLDNMLCILSKQDCYANRNLPNLSSVTNSGAIAERAQSLRKRIKEAHTALEYMGTTQVTPTGATFAPLTFGYYMINPNDTKEFLNYAEKKVFPYNEFSLTIDSFSSYAKMKSDYLVVWKVRRNGVEDPGLRYADKWNLEEHGPVVRAINSWYLLLPGTYELEIYVNGELVQSGSFEITPQPELKNDLPTNLRPGAPVPVGKLLFHEDFDNNNVNWWTGSGVVQEEGDINGELDMVTHEPDHAFSSSCTLCSTPNDFYLQTDVRYVQGQTDYGYGLIYRSTVNLSSFYAFLISPDGYYLVARYDGKWTNLIDWTESPLIQKEGKNQLGVWCRGSRCEFYINSTRVNAVNDSALNGLFMGVRVDHNDLEGAFDNVSVWSVQ